MVPGWTIFPGSLFGKVFFLLGLAIGGRAVWEMRRSKLRVQPEVAANARLVVTGPYRYLRNPMYLSVLTATAGWVIDQPGALNCFAWILLTFVLILKIKYEESLLKKAFPDYLAYSEKTHRLIPFVW